MAVTYDDVEEKNLGRNQKINQLADMKLMNDLEATEQNLLKEEEALNLQSQDTLINDARQIVNEMDVIRERGEDPMKLFEILPPELQEGVTQLLQQEEQENNSDLQQKVVPMLDSTQQKVSDDLVTRAKELTVL